VLRHLEYTRARFARTSERLRDLVYAETAPVDELLVTVGETGRISAAEARELDYRPAQVGDRFGPLFATYWFRVAATVPEAWAGRRVDLLFVSRSESTLWIDDRAVQGLNTQGGGERPDALLFERASGGERVELQIELACNGMFGKQRLRPELERCELAVHDPDAWRLLHDFETLRLLERDPSTDPALAGDLRERLSEFCNSWDGDASATWAAAGELLAAPLARHNGTLAHEIAAMGHAHLDTAWLWPLAETYRKAVRTLSSQTRYMDEYPEYRFAFSQAQQLAWIKERNPDLYERIRAKVAAGQFVLVGGSWVEPDCNVPSGESLLRQFVHGQRFFEREFGVRCREFWSPDAFGYCGQLPQIMRAAGLSRFLTQKLSWNRFNKPEQHTFLWRGDDGSEVLGHFPPADTYSSEATVPELIRTARDYKDHEHSGRSLLLFGHGDGGGGPTRTMLESLRRVRDLQGVPRTEQTTSEAFFDALEAEPGDRPVVTGELYFEYHRGTYTSQGRTKRGNRRGELALHDAEFLLAASGADVPQAELDRLWQLLLLQQFHDILPGSSIRPVYEDAERDLAAVEAGAGALWPAGDNLVNTTGFARTEVVDGALVAAEPYGIARSVDSEVEVIGCSTTSTSRGYELENEHLRVVVGHDGSLESVVHKATGRETLAGRGNVFELYDDRPVEFDAWDIDPFALETRRELPGAHAHELVTETPLRVEVAFEHRIGDASTLRQVVRLDAGSPRLEFRTEVDWHESHELLKVRFPIDVHATSATFEMPFGWTERPTHRSTSFERARYEVPGHRFADVAEHGFGAAVLSDCKYGWSCEGADLRLSLLRAPKSPDPEADMGRHEFAYALLPHAGGWREAGVLAEAIRFASPLRRTALELPSSFASVDDPALVLDTVKPADDGDGVVLRLYEAFGGRGVARVRLARPFSRAQLANALEEPVGLLRIDGDAVVLPYRPHELLTVRLS
jgi:alpha-mannosidase